MAHTYNPSIQETPELQSESKLQGKILPQKQKTKQNKEKTSASYGPFEVSNIINNKCRGLKNTFHSGSHFILSTNLWGRYHYQPHVTDQETGSER